MTEHRRRQSSGGGRVPPHNLQAEEAALGAALISVDGAKILVERLAPGDFYRPIHQHIAAAFHTLAAAGEPADLVTVAEELRRAGLLDDVGGIGYLAGLTNATPSIGRAAHYARIISDTAVFRRLIHTAAEIADLAYENPEDPGEAVQRAGALLSGMAPRDASRLATIEIADVAALLASDLQPEQPTLLTLTDGKSLLYPGKMHVFQAEPSSGKSWLALWAVAEVLAAGGAAVYLDFEDTPAGILTRLRIIGVPEEALRSRFVYVRIPGKFGPADRVALFATLDRLNPDLVVIDGVGESLVREGLSEDKAEDVLRWTELLPRPISLTGATVLMIDHVAKDPEQRGRWARGSGAKLGATDGASYQLKVRAAFSRHRPGRVDFVVAKDRPGGVGAIGETVATAHIEPAGAGELVRIRIEPPATTAPGDSWKPTVYMAKLWDAIDTAGGNVTASGALTLVHGKPQLIREALQRLLLEGYVEEHGSKPKRLRTARPYTERSAPAAPPPPDDPPPPSLFEHDPEEPTLAERAELDRYYDRPEF